jgi:serine palmitoyltransferase
MRANVDGTVFSSSMCPVVVQQVLSAFTVLLGEDGSNIGMFPWWLVFPLILHPVWWVLAGQEKLASIRRNSNYFRKALRDMGLEVLGDDDSPVIPIMLFNPAKIGAFSRECMKRGVRAVLCVRRGHEFVVMGGLCVWVWAAVGGGCGWFPCHAPC